MAGSNLAGVARVAFEADTGEFNRDIAAVERRYNESTGRMSDDAIRLGLAQDKLRRSLDRYGPTSRQAQRATLALRSAQRQAEAQAERTTRAVDRENRSFGQLGRGAIAGSGALRGLGRQVAFASGAFLGGAGITSVIRQSVSAFSNLNEQTTKTRQVFGGASNEVIAFSRDALGQAQDQALETASSIGALLRPLGVLPDEAAKTSITLTRLGTDLASFYNTDVADALAAIRSGLVGEVEPLRRYGTVLSETRVQQLALVQTGKENVKALTNEEKVRARVAIILRDTSQAQGDFARTSGGLANQQRALAANVREVEIAIGRALYPTVLRLTGQLNEWFSNGENVARIQRDVNEAVKTGTQVVHGLADGLEAVRSVAEPLNDALGGTRETVKLLLLAMSISKLTRFASGLGGIGAAAGEAGAAGEVGLLRRRLGGLNALTIAPIAIPIVYEITTKILNATGGDKALGRLGGRTFDALQQMGLFGGVKRPMTEKEIRARAELLRHYHLPQYDYLTDVRPDDRAVGGRRNPDPVTHGDGGGRKPPGDPGTGIPWLDNLLARDEATAGRGDDERDIRRAIAVLRGRLSRAKSLAARTELQRAINQYAGQLAQLEGQDRADAQAKIDAAREKAKNRRDRLAEQRRRRRERLAARQRAAEQRRETAVERTIAGFDRRRALTEATPDNDDNLRVLHEEMRFLRSQIKNTKLAQSFRDKLERDYTALIRSENALRRAKKQPKIETGRQQQAFLGELSGVLGQFASNVGGAAGSAPTGAVNHITINNPTPKSNFAMLREARLAAAHVF